MVPYSFDLQDASLHAQLALMPTFRLQPTLLCTSDLTITQSMCYTLMLRMWYSLKQQ